MARYEIDEQIFDTASAVEKWTEETQFNGSNMISRATGSQWVHETLFLSKKGQYWIETTSQWQGVSGKARLLVLSEAVLWLDRNCYSIPTELETIAESLEG